MKIIHCFRTPVGGVFRHVLDLVPEQVQAGHEVGFLCDSSTGGQQAIDRLHSIQDLCSLGIHRTKIQRSPGLQDFEMLREARTILKPLAPDILHSHGAKGGLIARCLNRSIGARSIYSPHAGVLNYDYKTPVGVVFLLVEKLLVSRSDGFIFVCDYERESFHQKIGALEIPFIVNYNGLRRSDFAPIRTNTDSTDVIFLGEIRKAKGVQYLLRALKLLKQEDPITATIVGDGPELEKMKTLCTELGLDAQVNFPGALPAREALQRGRVFVLPALHESFPYVLLEAAAKALPIVATDVGGVKELKANIELVPPADAPALANAIRKVTRDWKHKSILASKYRESMYDEYNTQMMTENTLSFYQLLL